MRKTGEVAVRFSAGTSGTAPIAVGQANMLRSTFLSDDPSHLNIAAAWDVPATMTVHRIVELISELLLHHSALRTTFPAVDPPVQSVAGDGEVPLELYERDGTTTVEDFRATFRSRAIDVRTQLPWRAALVLTEGRPGTLVVSVPHVAVDAMAMDLLGAAWDRLVSGQTLGPPTGPQPVDIVDIERGPLTRRLIESAPSQWESQLRLMPPRVFAEPVDDAKETRQPGLLIRSSTVARAVARIAERTRASRSVVVLAALAVLLGHRSRLGTIVIGAPSGNRVLPELRDFVGTIAQETWIGVDVDAPTFDAVVRKASSAAFAAHRRAWFDPYEIWRTIHRVGQQRGVHFARDCMFNDLTVLSPGAAHRLVDALSPADSAGPVETGDPGLSARLDWLPDKPLGQRMTFVANELGDEQAELALWADKTCLPRNELARLAGDLVRLLTAAGHHDVQPAAVIELPPVHRGPDWHLIDSCWVDLEAVRRLVGRALDGAPCHVTVEHNDEGGRWLRCWITAGVRPLTPELAHIACLDLLAGSPSAMTPHYYVICRDAPGDGESWQGLPVVAEGTGRAELAAATAARI